MSEENQEQQTPPNETSQETPPDETQQEETPSPQDSKTSEEAPAGETPPALTAEDLVIPEGFDVDEPTREKFLEIVNNPELDLKARANALVELQAETIRQASEKISEEWSKTRKEWADTAKADPEFGGDKFEANMGKVSNLLNTFGDPELREQVFDITGAGDHPLMIRFLIKVADALSEGTAVQGTPGGGEKTLAERMYPSMQKG